MFIIFISTAPLKWMMMQNIIVVGICQILCEMKYNSKTGISRNILSISISNYIQWPYKTLRAIYIKSATDFWFWNICRLTVQRITSHRKMKAFVAIIALCALVVSSNAAPQFIGEQSGSSSGSNSQSESQSLNQGENQKTNLLLVEIRCKIVLIFFLSIL